MTTSFIASTSVVQSSLLSKINERQVLRALQTQGPMSRAEVSRFAGMSAPTASKAVDALLRAGLLEEGDAPEFARGRPARKLRLPTATAQVLGLVIDGDHCRVVSAGLDGALHEDAERQFTTPESYEALVDLAAAHAGALMDRPGVTTLGLGISIPGLIDYRRQLGILSPNVPITNGRSPALDLRERLGLECAMVQESHALCLAERAYGDARGMDDFAMVDAGIGVGLGVVSGGRLITGHRGMAGELGHITTVADGRLCGCGNHGCLETVASDAALAWFLSRRLGRRVNIEEVIALARAGELDPSPELEATCRYLAIALAAVINLHNPATLFVHCRMFEIDDSLFPCVVEETRRRALTPSFADCTIVRARGSKRQGAVAGIIERLFNAVVPEEIADTRLVVK